MTAFDEDGREKLLALCDEYSLQTSSLSLGIYREENCLTTDNAEWQKGKEMLHRAIGAVTELGCAGILLPHFGPIEPDLDDPRPEPEDISGLPETLTSVSAAVIILRPVTFPWQTAPVVAVLCFAPRAWMLGLILAPMLWYLRFLKADPGHHVGADSAMGGTVETVGVPCWLTERSICEGQARGVARYTPRSVIAAATFSSCPDASDATCRASLRRSLMVSMS